jgi:hypothetical protein
MTKEKKYKIHETSSQPAIGQTGISYAFNGGQISQQ